MPKPVCVKCRCFYRPEKNGFGWTEGMPSKAGEHAQNYAGEIRGLRHPELWEPYKVWRSDLWKCPDCEHEIIVGHAQRPSAEHYQPNFQSESDALNAAEVFVCDC